ncbi:Tkl protein kinase [Globisporangium polare]
MPSDVNQARASGPREDPVSQSCPDGGGCTSPSSLIVAVTKAQFLVTKCLLILGADPTTTFYEGDSPLHLACANGNLALVIALLAAVPEPRRQRSFVDALNRNRHTALSLAVRNAFLDVVEVLLDHGASLEARDLDRVPLLIACARDHIAIARLLIARCANVHVSDDSDGQTLLHILASIGSLAVAEVLLDSGANIDALDRLEQTPLIIAAQEGRLTMVKLLVARGAQASLRAARTGQSALTGAATYGHLNILRYFVGLYGREIVDQHQLLHCAVAGGTVSCVEYLLSLHPDLEAKDEDGLTPLCSALCCLDTELVELLVTNGADVHAKHADNKNYSYLHVAAEIKHTAAVRILLTHGMNVNELDDQGGTALHVAAAVGAVEALQVLLDRGGNLFAETHDGFSATHAAASNGKLKVLKFLKAKGLTHDFEKVHAASPTVTPLSLAAGTTKGCKSGVVQYLVEYQDRQRQRVSLNSSTTSGSSSSRVPLTISQRLYRSDALICAVQIGHLETVQYLCAHGASIDLLHLRGASALMTAAEFGHVDILGYLLEEKAPMLDEVDYDGLMAIHYAAKNGHTRALKLLLAHGASVDEKTDPLPDGPPRFTETVPVHFAATHGHLKVLKMLVQHGADLEIPNANGRRAIQLVRMTRSGTELPGAVGFLLTNGTVDEYATTIEVQ